MAVSSSELCLSCLLYIVSQSKIEPEQLQRSVTAGRHLEDHLLKFDVLTSQTKTPKLGIEEPALSLSQL